MIDVCRGLTVRLRPCYRVKPDHPTATPQNERLATAVPCTHAAGPASVSSSSSNRQYVDYSDSDSGCSSDTSADSATRNRRRRRRKHRRLTVGVSDKRLPPHVVKILKRWLMSPEHYENPYPTEDEKAELLAATGITPKQLTTWFTNARKRHWAPRRKNRGEAVPLVFKSQFASEQQAVAATKRRRESTECLSVLDFDPTLFALDSETIEFVAADASMVTDSSSSSVPISVEPPVDSTQESEHASDAGLLTGTPVSLPSPSASSSQAAFCLDDSECSAAFDAFVEGALGHKEAVAAADCHDDLFDLFAPLWEEWFHHTPCAPSVLDVVPLLKPGGALPGAPTSTSGFRTDLTPLLLSNSKATSSA